MKIALVVFDIAGTTVNDADGVNRSLQEALAGAGVTVDRQAINEVMGLPKPEAIRLLLEGRAEPAGEARCAEIHADFVRRMLRFYETDPSVFPVRGAIDTFRRLREARIKVALDTGFDRSITAAVLRRLGWRDGDPIDASITSDEAARGRPHPDMILRLMERFGIADASQVAKVGDTPSDLEEGTRAGCALVVGVTSGTHSREQLARHPHTHLIASVADLPPLLGL